MPVTARVSKNVKFLLAVGVQLIIIAAIILSKMTLSAGGTEILLEIQPVDPRDLLRGDYATFQYKISRIDPAFFGGQQAKDGETVYVVLQRRGRLWNVQRVLTKKPEGGEIFIKGKVAVHELSPLGIPRPGPRASVHVVYGIEEYFIPEGQGGRLVPWRRTDLAVARVTVDAHGNAILREILLNGKPWRL